MLDENGDQRVTQDEFLRAATSVMSSVAHLGAKASPRQVADVMQVLDDISQYLYENTVSWGVGPCALAFVFFLFDVCNPNPNPKKEMPL